MYFMRALNKGNLLTYLVSYFHWQDEKDKHTRHNTVNKANDRGYADHRHQHGIYQFFSVPKCNYFSNKFHILSECIAPGPLLVRYNGVFTESTPFTH